MDQSASAPVSNASPAPLSQPQLSAEKPNRSIRKHLLLPISLLLVIGLGVFALLPQTKPLTTSVTPPKKLATSPQSLFLTITSPTEESVITQNTVEVSGKTLPHTSVMLFTNTADNSVESDGNGMFRGKITLTSGINTLTVTAFSETGEEKTVTIDLVYDDQPVQ